MCIGATQGDLNHLRESPSIRFGGRLYGNSESFVVPIGLLQLGCYNPIVGSMQRLYLHSEPNVKGLKGRQNVLVNMPLGIR